MKVRFDVNDPAGRNAFIRAGLPEALKSLTPGTRPRWGALTAAHMVEHLLWGFELSTGRLVLEPATSEEWQRKARAFLHDHRETPHGFENPYLRDGLPPLRFGALTLAIDALTSEGQRFVELAAADTEVRRAHPVFGWCSMEEWSRIHFKHGVHHLLQFGLIEVEPAD